MRCYLPQQLLNRLLCWQFPTLPKKKTYQVGDLATAMDSQEMDLSVFEELEECLAMEKALLQKFQLTFECKSRNRMIWFFLILLGQKGVLASHLCTNDQSITLVKKVYRCDNYSESSDENQCDKAMNKKQNKNQRVIWESCATLKIFVQSIYGYIHTVLTPHQKE